MAACERVAYFCGEIAPEPAEALAGLGVAVKVFDGQDWYAHSLIPSLLDPEETGFLVALSPQMTVKGDFSEWIGDTPFTARCASRDQFNLEALEIATAAFGKGLVLYDTRALFIRRDIARTLGAEWSAALNNAGPLLVGKKGLSVAAESIALSISLSNLQIAARELPISAVSSRAEEEIVSDNLVDLAGSFRHFNLGFDNASFWNNRYLTNPELGSGLGSRAAPRALKTALIRQTLERECSRSVLDIGCGDLATVGELPITDYTGIDIAATVIKANAARHPSWKFLAGDFLQLCDTHRFRADLVLCFDVLIHQHTFASYEAFARAMVTSCEGVGLVGAYQSPPRSQYRSEITAYHEPITRTLARFGLKKMRIVATYRDTVVVEFRQTE
jgi:hypothetical protein